MPGPGLPAALQDRKWQLKAADEVEWQQWLAQQKQAANITADTVYVQVGSGAHATACWLARPADGTVASLVNLRPAVPAACRLPCLVRWPPGSMPQCPKLRSRSLAALCNPPPLQVQLDGSVRASGSGIPPWQKFVDDLPELDSVRTKFTDGVGLS